MPEATIIPAPGQIARVRQRLYLVELIVQPPRAGDSTLVKLSCVDDDAQGQRLEVLWEREIDPEIITGEAWEAIAKRGFDPARIFAAYLNTLRWNCVTATDPRLFQSPFRAGIRLDAYQLEPLRKALLLPRVNLFIADDVGLGKTIEARLIARELLIRKKVRDIVIAARRRCCTSGKRKRRARFGLTFEILDKDYVTRVRRERGYGVNPWGTHTRFLVSHRLLIDETYAGPLARLAGRVPQRHAADPRRGPPRRPVQRRRSTPSTRRSPAPSATWPRGSSTGCSCPPRRTTATPTASRPCWRSSIRSGSAAACRSSRRCSTT